MSSSSPLTPTFYGHIGSTQDALILFEACLSGQLNHVARRPHDRERASLIKSGNVFIYEEHSSGIKRWTDGVPWSPSRILGNFLVYRELERPFPPGEKKRAMKRNKRSPGISKADPYPSRGPLTALSNGYATAAAFVGQNAKETERSLIGSLVDSYGFKEEGLVKKTISVTVNGVSHHLVSYYSVNDVMQKKLPNPSQDPRFSHTVPRQELITKQNFRSAIDEVDAMDGAADRHNYGTYGAYGRNGYEMTNQTISSHRGIPLPSPSLNFYAGASSVYNNSYSVYNGASGLPTPSYDTSIPTSTSPSYNSSQYAPAPGIYPAPGIKAESYKSEAYSPASQRPRFSSNAGISSDASRGQLTPGGFGRRHSAFGPHGTLDSGVSGVSALSIDAKSTDQGGVYSQQSYFDSTRDSSQSQNYAVQRALPTLSQSDFRQVDYNRNGSNPYLPVDHVTSKDTWSLGNQSNGHAHYGVGTQQQWASAAGT